MSGLKTSVSSSLPLIRRLAVIAYALALCLWCFRTAHRDIAQRHAFALSMASVAVTPPESLPPVGQESIDIALVMFGIEVPASAESPTFDPSLNDRGLTTRGAFMSKSQVTIGPAAFTSWSLLGSTLAHELEVHCRQNFFFISFMDAAHLDGTGEAERQAYRHELRNAKRFGLNRPDIDLIASTMEFYYPIPGDVPVKAPLSAIKGWLARNFLRGDDYL